MMKTQSGLRKKIVFVGQINSGKSSLINSILGENFAIVSDIRGTTTDAQTRAYELLGFGAVSLCDTAGFFDESELADKRIFATMQNLKTADLAVLVVNSNELSTQDKQILEKIQKLGLDYIIAYNKADIIDYDKTKLKTSTTNHLGIEALRIEIAKKLSQVQEKGLLDGIINPKDKILLVMPQDSSAPKGRLILPQVQIIREILDKNAIATCVAFAEFELALSQSKFDLIITDSKLIKQVLELVGDSQRVSTFSILFAKSKGDIDVFVKGAKAIDNLQNGDKVLIAEACVHSSHEDDIAKSMLPKLLQEYTKKSLIFEFASGKKLLEDTKDVKLILQCGGCMITAKEMQARIKLATSRHVPITNYGLAITKCQSKDIDRLTF